MYTMIKFICSMKPWLRMLLLIPKRCINFYNIVFKDSQLQSIILAYVFTNFNLFYNITKYTSILHIVVLYANILCYLFQYVAFIITFNLCTTILLV